MITVRQAFEQAFAHEAAGRMNDAAAIYREILAALPGHPGALLKLAQQDLAGGRPEAAREQLQRALDAARRDGLPERDIRLALGEAQAACGDVEAAVATNAELLAIDAADPLAQRALGVLRMRQRDPAAAERHFRRAAESDAHAGAALADCALAISAQRRAHDAYATARQAHARGAASLHCARVLSYTALRANDASAAVAAARDGLQRHPDDPELLARLADALRASGRAQAARQALEAAPAPARDGALLQACLGAVYLDLDLPGAAREALRRAVTLGDATAPTWDHLGLAERALGNHAAAIDAFARALDTDPALTPACSNLVRARSEVCAWEDLATDRARWMALAESADADPRCNPFIAVTQPTTPTQQLAIARRWSRTVLPAVAPRPRQRAARPARLRIGYLSCDLHEHPTARLIAGLFAAHDRQRFEVHVFSYGRDDGSAIRARMQAAVEHWVEIGALTDADAAQRIRAAGIDVLVDLKGHTQGARLGILAPRPAPLQLHYLGFPGTLGCDAIDGIVADDIVIPPGDERYYHERVLRLPRCYQVTDRERGLPDPAPRATLGLPDDAVVLACFNQTYKLSPEYFAVWLEVLARRPQTRLWLYAPPALARENLSARAHAAGVDMARIVFADALPQREHLARLRAADLALDVLPCGSHTTGSDALWAGVPLLTCRGDTFAGRVGASLLHAVGLPELVTQTLAQYRDMLLQLTADRAALAGYRDYLECQRLRLPLFDTPGFARDFEALLVGAWEALGAAPGPR